MRGLPSLLALISVVAAPLQLPPSAHADEPYCVPRAGRFVRFFDQSIGEGWPWHINDHSIVAGPDGKFHLFGITHPEPPDPHAEVRFAHASAARLTDRPWKKLPLALVADFAAGETLLWAPHVIAHEGLYYMFYCAGGNDPSAYQIKLATSTDLTHWERKGTLFTDGYEARDPYVLRVGDHWVMYYTATSAPAGGHHIVATRTSTDLLHWGEPSVAFTDPSCGTGAGPTESPFVVARDEGYYLFTGPRHWNYNLTEVFFSTDPLHFAGPPVAQIPAHAPEVVRDLNGREYITHCGFFQGGVYMAELSWSCSPR
jgi:arabinan endo-1,5-alpha-L-arabinosidase